MISFDKVLDATREIATGKVSLPTRKAVSRTAEGIDRSSDLQAYVEKVKASMLKFMPWLYEKNIIDYPANFDRHTGQILIPVPWGKNGYQVWGLRSWEAECLRKVLLDRCSKRGGVPELFDYSNYTRRWYVQASDYPTLEHALHWLKECGPNAHEWEAVTFTMAKDRNGRREKQRSKLRRKKTGSR